MSKKGSSATAKVTLCGVTFEFDRQLLVVASVILPPDGAHDATRRWLETLHTVGHHHNLRWLALSAVVVAWQAPAVGVGP